MQKYVYPNGFTVVYQPSTSKINLTSIYVFVKVGSCYENEDIRGASHFIEHMCFKGTKQILSSNELLTFYSSIGTSINAFTEKDHSCFETRCQDIFVEKCLKHMSDIMLNSTFPQKEIKLELPIMREEMIRDSDDVSVLLNDTMDALLYDGTPYAFPVDHLDNHKDNMKYKYGKIMDFYHTNYQSSQMVLSICSSLSFSKIRKILEKTFYTNEIKEIKESKEMRLQKLNLQKPNQQEQIKYKIEKKSGINGIYLALSFQTCEHSNVDRFALNLLGYILGGYMSSRMFMLLREKNGLTYELSCYTDYNLIGGEITMYLVLDGEKLFRNGNKIGVLPLLIKLIKDLKKNGVTTEELKIAKTYLQNKFLMNLEKNTHSTFYNGIHETLYSDEPFVPYPEIFKQCYSSITVDDVKRVISQYFQQEKFCVGLVGENPPSLRRVQEICQQI
jgi:predicted Zn-dependent peptidase